MDCIEYDLRYLINFDRNYNFVSLLSMAANINLSELINMDFAREVTTIKVKLN